MKKSSVAVLMSSYNGEKYIYEQIDCVLAQKDVDIHLFVRDDGSSDNTISILKTFNKEKNVTTFFENNIGYAKSFWNLLKRVDDYDYYCFCDQDDIWLDNKIISAINLIEKNYSNKNPVLYTSKVISINKNKEIISYNTFDTYNKLDVYESFQKSKFPGCVFVFNKAARNILIQYDGYMESHDWAAYNIISVLGNTIFDDNSYIRYRLHETNAIGKANKFKEFLKKIKNFFRENKCTRSRFAKDFYNTFNKQIPYEYLKEIHALAFYKNSFKDKLTLIKSKKFKGTIFKLYVLLGKI